MHTCAHTHTCSYTCIYTKPLPLFYINIFIVKLKTAIPKLSVPVKCYNCLAKKPIPLCCGLSNTPVTGLTTECLLLLWSLLPISWGKYGGIELLSQLTGITAYKHAMKLVSIFRYLRHLNVFSIRWEIAKCPRTRWHFSFKTRISIIYIYLGFIYELCLINWVEIPRKIWKSEINRIPNTRKCLKATQNSEKAVKVLTYHLHIASRDWVQWNLHGEHSVRRAGVTQIWWWGLGKMDQ